MMAARRVALVIVACAAALAVGEGVVRTYDAYVLGTAVATHEASPLYVLTDAPHRYELRPGVRRYRGRIDINALGLRGPEVADPQAATAFRILFIGDSVTFGGEVPYEATFPAKVEAILRQSADPHFVQARSLNGGVPGYSPFNELYWLREKGPQLHPDVVVIQFCLNDVVDPLPQWSLAIGEAIPPGAVPAEAIPNPATHRRVIWLQWLRHSRLVTRAESVWPRPTVLGWPAYLTEEQPLSIEVYSNRKSPEVRWLRRMYLRLIDEARQLTPNVVIVFVPLAYQLMPGYPIHSPQEVMTSIAVDNDVPIVDLTAALRPLGPSRGFRPGRPGAPDIWHLSEAGHDAAAHAIAAALTFRNER